MYSRNQLVTDTGNRQMFCHMLLLLIAAVYKKNLPRGHPLNIRHFTTHYCSLGSSEQIHQTACRSEWGKDIIHSGRSGSFVLLLCRLIRVYCMLQTVHYSVVDYSKTAINSLVYLTFTLLIEIHWQRLDCLEEINLLQRLPRVLVGPRVPKSIAATHIDLLYKLARREKFGCVPLSRLSGVSRHRWSDLRRVTPNKHTCLRGVTGRSLAVE